MNDDRIAELNSLLSDGHISMHEHTGLVTAHLERMAEQQRRGAVPSDSVFVSREERRALIRVALGNTNQRTEHRFRHRTSGLTVVQLDLSSTSIREWVSEWRTVIETEWRTQR